MSELHTINQVPPNPQGICALSCSQDPADVTQAPVNNFLAYPGSLEKGEVYVYDVVNLKAFDVIEAHNSPISCLAFSPNGDTLATASCKVRLRVRVRLRLRLRVLCAMCYVVCDATRAWLLATWGAQHVCMQQLADPLMPVPVVCVRGVFGVSDCCEPSQGTVIRVFATPSGEKLFELRRGIQTSAQIFSMAFNEDASLLSVSSDKASQSHIINQNGATSGFEMYFYLQAPTKSRLESRF